MNSGVRYIPLDGSVVEDRLRPAGFANRAEWFDYVVRRLCASHKSGRERNLENRYRWLLHDGMFLPTSTLLANVGANRSTVGGCLVWPFPKTLAQLKSQTIADIKPLLELGQGIGFDLTTVRPRGCNAEEGSSPGPLLLLEALLAEVGSNSIIKGVKRPAFMVSMIYDHPEAFELICFKTIRGAETINISIAVDSLFHESISRDGHFVPRWIQNHKDIYLTAHVLKEMEINAEAVGMPSPDLYISNSATVYSRAASRRVGRVIGGKILISCESMLRVISECAHKCGDPGLLNISAINDANPTHGRYLTSGDVPYPGVGTIHTTAPCGEQPLLEYESCFLGSLDLRKFVSGHRLDLRRLYVASAYAVCMLDDFISISEADERFAKVIFANRKVGVGMMGLADVLADLEVPYGSAEARGLACAAAEAIQKGAQKGSERLALVRGCFTNWRHSRFCHGGSRPRRNATLTTLAPTGHIAKMAGCSASIEPLASLALKRNGKFVINEVLERKLSEIGYSVEMWVGANMIKGGLEGWDGTLGSLSSDATNNPLICARLEALRRVFVTANELQPDNQLEMVAALQSHVENGISKTIAIRNDAGSDEIFAIFLSALERRVKGITVFRTAN